MKKILLVLMLSISLFSCSKDDSVIKNDSEEIKRILVSGDEWDLKGDWDYTSKYKFNEDGTYIIRTGSVRDTLYYFVSDNSIRIYDEYGNGKTVKVTSYNEDSVKYKELGVEYEYTRMNYYHN